METATIIVDVALGLVAGLSLLMIKWIREDIKESKAELKQEIKDLRLYLEGQFTKIGTLMEHHSDKISNIEVSLGKLETRVEERTLKVIHVERTKTEHQAKSG